MYMYMCTCCMHKRDFCLKSEDIIIIKIDLLVTLMLAWVAHKISYMYMCTCIWQYGMRTGLATFGMGHNLIE